MADIQPFRGAFRRHRRSLRSIKSRSWATVMEFERWEPPPYDKYNLVCHACGSRWVLIAPRDADVAGMNCPGCRAETAEHAEPPYDQPWVDGDGDGVGAD